MISIREIYDVLVSKKYLRPLKNTEGMTDLDFVVYFNYNDITVRNSKVPGVTTPIVRKRGRNLHLFEKRRE